METNKTIKKALREYKPPVCIHQSYFTSTLQFYLSNTVKIHYDLNIFSMTVFTLDFDLYLSDFKSEIWHKC